MPRVLVGKAGLDGHDRGAKVVVRALRDAGIGAIYSGLHQTPAMLAHIASQQRVDGIGLSVMSGAHRTLFPRLIIELHKRGLGHLVLFGGGIIPAEDAELLAEMGVRKLFPPGSSLAAITDWVWQHVPQQAEPAPRLKPPMFAVRPLVEVDVTPEVDVTAEVRLRACSP